jgi:hypothetical protein
MIREAKTRFSAHTGTAAKARVVQPGVCPARTQTLRKCRYSQFENALTLNFLQQLIQFCIRVGQRV